MMLKIVTAFFGVVCAFSGVIAGGMFWSRTWGDCANGCEGGMVFILLLPMLAISLISGVITFVCYRRWPGTKA